MNFHKKYTATLLATRGRNKILLAHKKEEEEEETLVPLKGTLSAAHCCPPVWLEGREGENMEVGKAGDKWETKGREK